VSAESAVVSSCQGVAILRRSTSFSITRREPEPERQPWSSCLLRSILGRLDRSIHSDGERAVNNGTGADERSALSRRRIMIHRSQLTKSLDHPSAPISNNPCPNDPRPVVCFSNGSLLLMLSSFLEISLGVRPWLHAKLNICKKCFRGGYM